MRSGGTATSLYLIDSASKSAAPFFRLTASQAEIENIGAAVIISSRPPP